MGSTPVTPGPAGAPLPYCLCLYLYAWIAHLTCLCLLLACYSLPSGFSLTTTTREPISPSSLWPGSPEWLWFVKNPAVACWSVSKVIQQCTSSSSVLLLAALPVVINANRGCDLEVARPTLYLCTFFISFDIFILLFMSMCTVSTHLYCTPKPTDTALLSDIARPTLQYDIARPASQYDTAV